MVKILKGKSLYCLFFPQLHKPIGRGRLKGHGSIFTLTIRKPTKGSRRKGRIPALNEEDSIQLYCPLKMDGVKIYCPSMDSTSTFPSLRKRILVSKKAVTVQAEPETSTVSSGGYEIGFFEVRGTRKHILTSMLYSRMRASQHSSVS